MSISIFHSLLEACAEAGCPVCGLVERSVLRYLDGLFYECVTDEDTRFRLRSSLGFCFAHAWQALDSGLADALGVSIIYHDLVGSLLQGLPEPGQSAEGKSGPFTRLSGLLKPATENARRAIQALTAEATCPACLQQEMFRSTTIDALLQGLEDERLSAALEKSDGLCLPHLRAAFERSNPAQAARLLAILRPKLQSLRGELAEFIRKNDYRYVGEPIGDERDAWQRAVGLVVGKKPGLKIK
jgi:hypothetical protein